MIHIRKQDLSSWMGRHEIKDAIVIEVESEAGLIQAMDLYPEAKVAGSFHSYNEGALSEKVIVCNYRDMEFNKNNNTLTVSAGCTIDDVIEELLRHGRRLINRGNFSKQTYIGAAVTGTHGFGPMATLMDQVIRTRKLGDVILSVTINTAPLTSYRVRHSSALLSETAKRQNRQRAYAVFPYTGKDPVCFRANYKEVKGRFDLEVHQYGENTEPPFALKLFWCIDEHIPIMRRLAQKVIGFIHGINFKFNNVMYTHPLDVDAIYDPMPGLAGKSTWNFGAWSFRPTFTSDNIAMFIPVKDTEQFILDAIEIGEGLQRNLFKGFIGVRELTDKSEYENAGNHMGPVNAVDFYCSPKHSKYLQELQHRLDARYIAVRKHHGKSVFPTEVS